MQLSSGQEEHQTFDALDAQVLGISTNHPASQKASAKQLGLDYPLLSAFDHPEVVESFGGWHDPEKRLARRAYFVIDKKGTIRLKRIMENPAELLPMEEIRKVLEGLKTQESKEKPQ